MNLDKSNTLDRHDVQEPMPSFQITEPPLPESTRDTDGCGW